METVENEENTTTVVSRRKETSSNEQQYIPSTSGSGMQIITHIPHFIIHSNPEFCMTELKSVTIALL